MTNATTNADRAGKRPSRMAVLIALSLVIHAVLLLALAPFAVSRMRSDPEQIEAQALAVKQREAARHAEESERRSKLPLDEKTADLLDREAELRKRPEMVRHVQELVEAKRRIEEDRQRVFEELRRRTPRDVARQAMPDLERKVEQLQREINPLPRATPADAGLKDRLNHQVKELKDALRKVEEAPDPAKALGEVAARSDDLADQLKVQREAPPQPQSEQVDKQLEAAQQAAGNLTQATQQLQAMMAADDLNSTAAAEPPVDAPAPPQIAGADAAELYDMAQTLEEQAHDTYDDVRAAELAMSQNTTFADAKANLSTTRPQRADLRESLAQRPSRSVGELNHYREQLSQAADQMDAMATRSQALAQQSAQFASQPPQGEVNRFAQSAMLQRAVSRNARGAVIDLTGLLSLNLPASGAGTGSSGMDADLSGEGANMVGGGGRNESLIKLPPERIFARAMPGRMFTDESARKGWLYIDTWYVIGPWENHSLIDFDLTHPPEYEIDFDARYTDGKFANKPNHPYHTLRWRFVQSDHIRVQPPDVHAASTYYAYTEVYFDRDRDMYLSIASDDAARVWVNGQPIWQDFGQSQWTFGEGYRLIPFNKGYNTLLVRIENGPGRCIWSVLLCPAQ